MRLHIFTQCLTQILIDIVQEQPAARTDIERLSCRLAGRFAGPQIRRRLYKELYGLDTYGLRYFNVFGRRQDPDGMYAAVIPKFLKQLLHQRDPLLKIKLRIIPQQLPRPADIRIGIPHVSFAGRPGIRTACMRP